MDHPHLEFELPTSHYHVGESIPVVMLPAAGGDFDVKLSPLPPQFRFISRPTSNRLLVKPGLPEGEYTLKARWKAAGFWPRGWGSWSRPLRFTIHAASQDLSELREHDHRLSLMLERGVGESLTLLDPEAEPPGRVGLTNPKWFATPVFEGATPLVNEERDYYHDPARYYFDCIDQLLARGARFITWHDLLAGNHNRASIEVLLQFDVDGGPKSMRRMFEVLASRGVRASMMIHHRGHTWYPYELKDLGVEWIQDAERLGWAIGYHNNSLSQVVGANSDDIVESALKDAARLFWDDVNVLRQFFDIRTFTHHGGNVFNLKVHPPEGLGLIGVDRSSSPALWQSIRSMFSDGGFTSRPTTLRRKIETLTAGLHFFRNHPFKYANYTPPVDVPPRFQNEFFRAKLEVSDNTLEWCRKELAKETCWLQQRHKLRSPLRLNYLRLDKAISCRFKPYPQIAEKVMALRQIRKQTFLRLYPWPEGDPRVFWWRMLEAWAPQKGEILNVGALPPGQKDEQAAFLSPDVVVKDMDIDPERSPDFLLDISLVPESFNGRFSATFLFGLPYFSSPSIAVESCARITAPGGLGLFGFTADTHPARGSVWHPKNRHLWNKSKEPLNNIGLKDNLWAFDQESLPELFKSWSIVRSEFMGHYWFVVTQKDSR